MLRELQCYADAVSAGSYIIVQDTDISAHPVFPSNYKGEGLMEAVEAFLASNDQFVPDKRREKLLLTIHPMDT